MRASVVKRTVSLTLALLLILTPAYSAKAASVPEAFLRQEDIILTAYRAASVTADAQLTEAQWCLRSELYSDQGNPSGRIGVLWDGSALYVALRCTDTTVIGLRVNGKDMTYDLVGGSFTSCPPGVTGSSGAGVAEFRIPFAAVGAVAQCPGRALPFSITLTGGAGTTGAEGSLLLSGDTILFADDCEDLVLKSYRDYFYQTGTYFGQGMDGTYAFHTTDPDSRTIAMARNTTGWDGGAVSLSFAVKINDLPVVSQYPAYRGFVIELRSQTASSADPYHKILLAESPEGYVQVVVPDGTNMSTVRTYLTDYLVADQPMLDVRFTRDEQAQVSIEINGELIGGHSAAAATVANGAVDSYIDLQMINVDNVAGTGGVDVDLTCVLATVPSEATASAQAYYCDAGITTDAVLSEYGWYVEKELSGVGGGAPSAKMGLLWSPEVMHIALRQSGATGISMTLGGETVTYDPDDDTFSVLGASGATNGGVTELSIPFEAFGFENAAVNQSYSLTVRLDGADGCAYFDGSVVFINKTVLFAEDGEEFVAEEYSSYVQNPGTYLGQGENGVIGMYTTSGTGLAMARHDVLWDGGAFEMEYTYKIYDLPRIEMLQEWRGLIIELRSKVGTANPYVKLSLCESAQGYIQVNAVNTANMNGFLSGVTDIPVAEQPTVTIRYEEDSDRQATVYVNGEILLQYSAAAATVVNSSARAYLDMDLINTSNTPGTGSINADLIGIVTLKTVEPRVNMNTRAYMADPAPVLDGSLADSGWSFNGQMTPKTGTSLPSGSYAIQWDGTYLYSAVRYAGASMLKLSLDGVDVVYSLDTQTFSPAVSGAAAVKTTDTIELRIPFAAFDINTISFNKRIPFSVELSNATGTVQGAGQLMLAGEKLIDALDASNYAAGGLYLSMQYPNAGDVATAFSYGAAADGSLAFSTCDYSTSAMLGFIKPVTYYDGGPFTFQIDTYIESLTYTGSNVGWSGYRFVFRDSGYMYTFSFYDDGYGGILLTFMRNGEVIEAVDTGASVGSRNLFRIELDKDMIPTLFVNGEQRYRATAALDYAAPLSSGAPRVEIFVSNYHRDATKPNYGGGINAKLYGYVISRTEFADVRSILSTVLYDVTAESVMGTNTDTYFILNDLDLTDYVTLPFTQEQIDIEWSSSDTSVISDEGVVNNNTQYGRIVTMTASVSKEGVTLQKELVFQVPAVDPNGVTAVIRNDQNPYTGAAEEFHLNYITALDTDHISLVYDLGETTAINRVVITDEDDISRVNSSNLSLYVSDDNVTYRRVNEWSLRQIGSEYYFINFSETCRYVKVHSHCDSIDPDAPVTFSCDLSEMIRADYTNELPGANGGVFSGSLSITVSNPAQSGKTDETAYVPLSALCLAPSEHQQDMADIRFVCDGRLLAHYFNGNGFYVRIPAIGANDQICVTMYYGNPSALTADCGRETFQVEYGKTTLDCFTVPGLFEGEFKVRTMPNGDVIGVGSRKCERPAGGTTHVLTARRSTDGGRTWGDPYDITPPTANGGYSGGGFLVDDETDRVFYFGFDYVNFDADSMANSYCRMIVIHSDDSGATWSAPQEIVQQGRNYTVCYTNAIKTSVADGAGSNIDYMTSYGMQINDEGALGVGSVYSRDGGATWQKSDNYVFLSAAGFEGGLSESAQTELSDGSILMIMRAQYDSARNFYKVYSYNFGQSWVNNPIPSNIPATNTLPVLARFNGDINLLWAGNNTMGGTSYMRFPLNVAYSDDDAASWKNVLDVTLGTSLSFFNRKFAFTQPDITYTQDGGALLSWANNNPNLILIEDYADYLYKTKGAYNGFEGSYLMTEGWTQATDNMCCLSQDNAFTGSQSLMLAGRADSVMMVSRNIPGMTEGTLSYRLYQPENAGSAVYTLLKAAHNLDSLMTGQAPDANFTKLGLCVTPQGAISITSGTSVVSAGTISRGAWHEFEVSFNIAAGTASLYVDGTHQCDVTISGRGDSITTIQFTDGSSGSAGGVVAYVDDFIATLESGLTVSVDE